MSNNKPNGVATFLYVLGMGILVLGFAVSIALATMSYDFNVGVFLGGLFTSAVSGGTVLGLAEIVNKLHKIEQNTVSINDMSPRIVDIRDYQQELLEAIKEKQES